MCGVSAGAELLEGAPYFVSKRGASQRLDERAAEVQRAELRHGQAGGKSFEGLSVQDPPRSSVVARAIVEDREAGFLERLQIAADRPGGDVAQGGEFVDGDAGRSCALDFAEDRPLADDLGIPGHAKIVQSAIRS